MEGDEMSIDEQKEEWKEYKVEMRSEVKEVREDVKEIKESINNINYNQGLAQKDIEAILKVSEELCRVVYKDNGQPSIMARLVQHATWIKIYGTIIVLIVGGIITGYHKLTAAPPIVAVEVTSKG